MSIHREAHELRFGTSLSRHDCPKCGPNSLHKSGRCIHCGRAFVAQVTRPKDWKRIMMSNLAGRKR